MFILGKGASGRSFSAKHVYICPCGHHTGLQKGVDVFIFFVVLLECYKRRRISSLLPFAVEKAENKKIAGGGNCPGHPRSGTMEKKSVCPRPVPQGSPAWFPHPFHT